MELWLPTYQRWEPLPYDAQFQEVATRYNLDRRQEYWDFMLRLAHWSHCGKLWRLVDMKVSCVSLLTAGIHAQMIKRQTCYYLFHMLQ